MIYSSRLKRILDICLRHEGESVSMDALAEKLKISKRTIFRELHDVDTQLAPYGVRLVTKAGKGIHVEGDEEHRYALLKALQTSQIHYINKEERQRMLIFELLQSEDIQKLIHYANIFQVSEATISNDLDQIRTWFAQFHITIQRKQGIGVELIGSEPDKRKAMTSIVHDALREDNVEQINHLNTQKVLEQIFLNENQNSIMKLLDQVVVEQILHIFEQYTHELQLDQYAQSSYIGMIIHLAIAIDRIQKHEPLSDAGTILDFVKEDPAYQSAVTLTNLLEIEFDIQIPPDETAFIALHMMGAKTNATKALQDCGDMQKPALLIQRMLTCFDAHTRMVLQQDEQFLQGLITHLDPALIRMRNGMRIYNPLLPAIKQQYAAIFSQTQKACARLEETFDVSINEDEVGFITMHIGAALERQEHQSLRRILKIAVVCASGIGVSALLSARIANAFHHSVRLKTLSMEEMMQDAYLDCDLLVSTFQLEDVKIPCVQVDPLLTAQDVKHIQQCFNALEDQKAQAMEIQHDVYQDLQHMHVASGVCLDVLSHLAYKIVDSSASIEDIMQHAARLVTSDTQKQAQIFESLQAREALGSIIMPTYGFAMLHAKSVGITHCSMVLLYPQTACYQNPKLKDISFVIVLLMPQDKDAICAEVMGQLSRSLLEVDAYRNALKARDQYAIRTQILQVFQNYFAQW